MASTRSTSRPWRPSTDRSNLWQLRQGEIPAVFFASPERDGGPPDDRPAPYTPPMAALYPQIKLVHIWAVILSGALFALRGALTLAGSRLPQHALPRYLSYAIDTVLLTA